MADQEESSEAKGAREKERMHQWYLRNRKRVLRAARKRYKADPEKVKARVAKWQKDHPERCLEMLQSWREKNPEQYREQGRRAYNVRRGKKYPKVSDEMLRLCREDPRRAVGIGSLAGLEMAICLECGERHPQLEPHVARQHMPVIEYKWKWGYAKNSALASARVCQAKAIAGRRIAEVKHPVPPPVNELNAAAGRRQWAGAKEKRLNLRDAHLERLISGTAKRPSRKKARPGRPSKHAFFLEAKQMRDSGLSWTQIAIKLDPAGYRKDRRAATERIRGGVRRIEKIKS